MCSMAVWWLRRHVKFEKYRQRARWHCMTIIAHTQNWITQFTSHYIGRKVSFAKTETFQNRPRMFGHFSTFHSCYSLTQCRPWIKLQPNIVFCEMSNYGIQCFNFVLIRHMEWKSCVQWVGCNGHGWRYNGIAEVKWILSMCEGWAW